MRITETRVSTDEALKFYGKQYMELFMVGDDPVVVVYKQNPEDRYVVRFTHSGKSRSFKELKDARENAVALYVMGVMK